MKKVSSYVGAICSAFVGIFSFVWLSLACLSNKSTAGNITTNDTMSGWEILKESFEEVNGFTLYKLFTIIMLVVAVLLIVSAIITILSNLNILKVRAKNILSLINCILLVAFVVCAIFSTIGAGVMAKELTMVIDGFATMKTSIGIGVWINLIISVLACACSWFFKIKNNA